MFKVVETINISQEQVFTFYCKIKPVTLPPGLGMDEMNRPDSNSQQILRSRKKNRVSSHGLKVKINSKWDITKVLDPEKLLLFDHCQMNR